MIISTNIEKALHKNPTPFHHKNIQQPGNQRELPHLRKGIYE